MVDPLIKQLRKKESIAEEKQEYLRSLIGKLLEAIKIEQLQSAKEEIIKHRTILALKREGFTTDKSNFSILKKFMEKCRSYNEWLRLKGEDLEWVQENIKITMIQLFHEYGCFGKKSMTFIEQTLKNPMSLIILVSEDLMNKQKKGIYCSKLMEELKHYSKILTFG